MKRMVAILLALLLCCVPLSARANALPPDVVSKLRGALTEMGVDGATQGRLIAKLEKGQMWDSLTVGESPVRVERMGSVTREVYRDGSVIVTTIG